MREPGASRRWSGSPGSGRMSPPRGSTTQALAASTIRAVAAIWRVRFSACARTAVTAAITSRSAGPGRVLAEQAEEPDVPPAGGEQPGGQAAAEPGRQQVLGPGVQLGQRYRNLAGEHRRPVPVEAESIDLGVGLA